MTPPRIGLNCDVADAPSDGERLQLLWAYAEAVLRAGGLPVPLAPVDGPDRLAQQLDALNGLLLTGGRDYAPALYGQPQHPATRLLHPRRLRYDPALAAAALARGLPVLGVCGGAQLVNIARGGTLAQHVPAHARPPGGRTFHTVRIAPDSRLARIVGTTSLETNSSHHQAIDRAGEGLRVVATAEDGVVEALEGEDDGPFLLAVQWHPERLLDRPRHLALFEALVRAAAGGA